MGGILENSSATKPITEYLIIVSILTMKIINIVEHKFELYLNTKYDRS